MSDAADSYAHPMKQLKDSEPLIGSSEPAGLIDDEDDEKREKAKKRRKIDGGIEEVEPELGAVR